jgi:uncharacterized Fe-S cluster protein YjdI
MKHEFSGNDITITYDDATCTHAANCVRSLPAVFDADRSPWIEPNAAPIGDVIAAVKACPSGALRYELKERPDQGM